MKKMHYLLVGLLSYFCSCALYLGSIISHERNIVEKFCEDFHFSVVFFIITLLLAIPIYFLILGIIKYVSKINIKESKNIWNTKKIRIISFVTIFLGSLIFLLVYYPGSNMNDTLYIIFEPIDHGGQYPLVYGLIISKLYYFFERVFLSSNISFFILGLFQTTFISWAISKVITWFHDKFKRNIATIILIIYFSCVPMMISFNTVLIRDPLFSVFLLLALPYLYEIIETKGNFLKKDNNILKLILCLGGMCLVRNNGIYVFIFLIIILLIKYRKVYKQLLFLLFGVLLLVYIPELLPANYQREKLFQESVAIPIQQLTYITKYRELDKEDAEYLDSLLPIEVQKKVYNPLCVDSIKWNYAYNRNKLNKTKGQFISIWFKYLPIYFEDYVKAYLLETLDLWSIEEYTPQQGTFLGLDMDDIRVIRYFRKLKNQDILPNVITKPLKWLYEHTVVYFNNATCFYILIIYILCCIYKKRNELIILGIPLLAVWLTLMISTPLSSAFRYMSSYAYLLPFLLMILFSTKNIEKKETDKV